jgi:hypothetical protein
VLPDVRAALQALTPDMPVVPARRSTGVDPLIVLKAE